MSGMNKQHSNNNSSRDLPLIRLCLARVCVVLLIFAGELSEHRKSICRTLGLTSMDYVCVSGEEYLIQVPRKRVCALRACWLFCFCCPSHCLLVHACSARQSTFRLFASWLQLGIVPKDWLTISATKQNVRFRSPFIIERVRCYHGSWCKG